MSPAMQMLGRFWQKCLFGILFMFFLSATAWGQPMCAPREQVVARLSQEFGEVPTAPGLMGNGNLMEITTAPSGTWTVLVTRPDGLSCFVASGDGWVQKATAVPRRGA